MAKIAVIGGKLQGVEAAYLGNKAGIETILIDKDPEAVAQNLCTRFICADVMSEAPEVIAALKEADMVLPAIENDTVLEGIVKLCKREGCTLAFDMDAYKITSSKKKSDRLFSDKGMPAPAYYPKGSFPYIVKPDNQSGSRGVAIIDTPSEMIRVISENNSSLVIQEFVEGPSYSMEIIGMPGNYRTYEMTQIFTDDVYDCNLAAVYRNTDNYVKRRLEELIVETAEALQLKGIMDIEVIEHNGELKILEIDARLPSQTPTAVFHASGMNYIRELYDLFCRGGFRSSEKDSGLFASVSHYEFSADPNTAVRSQGEHIMSEGRVLDYTCGICSDAQVISDYIEGAADWRGTFINTADSYEKLRKKELHMLEEFRQQFGEVKGEKHDHIFCYSETETDGTECR